MTAPVPCLELEREFASLDLEAIRRFPERIIFETEGASLLDLDDGVLCLEFHSKGNTLGEDAFTVAERASEIIPGKYRGLVIGNQGAHFSGGFDLRWLLQQAEDAQKDHQGFYEAVKRMQRIVTGMRTAPFPTVAAPFNLTYGSALQWAMFCDRVQTLETLSARFPEIALGMFPALGGTSELYARSVEHFGIGHLQEALRFSFETIIGSRQSADADDACCMLFLNETDRMTIDRPELIAEAKARVLYLAEDYAPTPHRKNIHVLGALGYHMLEASIEADVISGRITGHDVEVAQTLARVMTGGADGLPRQVPQEEFFDIEAAALTELIYHPKTRERIEHILVSGKPLRN